MARILLFGVLAELAGTKQLELKGDSVEVLLEQLADRYGERFRTALSSCAIAIDGQELRKIGGSVRIDDQSEVAIMPPVSGGAPRRHVRMADVGDKPITQRSATAECFVTASPQVLDAATSGALPKGSIVPAAEIAGFLGAKLTPQLLPLCHPITFDVVDIRVERTAEDQLRIITQVRGRAHTGYEMEALVAASAAALCVYDMIKSQHPGAVVGPLRLLAKEGGKSGSWRADSPEQPDFQPP